MSSKAELKQARQLIAKEQYADALQVLDLVLEYEDDNLAALLMKGVALQRLERYDESLKTINSLLKLDPTNIMAMRALAAAYVGLKKPRELFDISMKAISQLGASLEKDCTDQETSSIMSQISDIYKRLKQQIRKNDVDLYDRLLELEVDMPDDMITEPDVSQRNVIHRAISIIKPSLFDSKCLENLIDHRLKQFDKESRLIDNRQKTTVGITMESTIKKKLNALAKAKILDLLNLYISQEDDDEARRKHESLLLNLLTDELKNTIKLSGNTNKSGEIIDLQSRIRDLSERMAMFGPVEPLALELSWDYEAIDCHRAITELSAINFTEKGYSLKKNTGTENKKSKKNDSIKRTSGNDAALADSISKLDVSERNSEEDLASDTMPASKFLFFLDKFPNSGLAKILSFYVESNTSNSKKVNAVLGYDGDSVFGWHLAAEALNRTKRYQDSIDAAQAGIKAISIRKRVYGMMHVGNSLPFFKYILAQAYTHHQAPKNWDLAIENFNFVLDNTAPEDPEKFGAILGKGTLLAKMGQNDEALSLLEQALTMDPHNTKALSDLSWIRILQGDRDVGIDGLKKSISISNTKLMNAEMSWRIGYANWTAPKSQQEQESCYEYFVKAIEYDANYAPAYTYLGLFYDELVGDKERAHRCFYNSLEHDSGELIAGEKLAEDFAANSQWDLVEAVANTVLSSSRAKSDKELDWPYRALGIARLNQLKHADAVKYFQKCLRSATQDVLAWIGLGEAYIYSGRYRSAEKALGRALKLQPRNFSAWYVLSLAQRDMYQFPQSAASLQKAIEYAPEFSLALQWAMADNSLRAAEYLFEECFLRDALLELQTACQAVFTAFEEADTNEPQLNVFFATASEICLQLDRLGYHSFDQLPQDIFDITATARDFQKFMLPNFSLTEKTVVLSSEFSTEYVARTADDKKSRRVSAHAIAAISFQKCQDTEAAAEHFKAAIQLESRNDELWSAYGVCLTRTSPEVAQHCFIRALSLNGRNADTWVNLAALYLIVQDYELALEAVDHALSLEPEHSRAWIGQALAEQALGTRSDDHLYRTLEYAYNMSFNDELAGLALALKEYGLRSTEPSPAALGALEKIMALRTGNRTAEFVLGLLLERKKLYAASLQHLKPLKVWPHIARVELALQQYETALDAAAQVPKDASNEDRLGALLVSGLAHYFMQDLDAAIVVFTEALDLAKHTHEDVLRLLVEVLCASMDSDAQQVAQDQLFDSIAENGATLQVTLLLGALGFINKDETVIEAAKQELETLITPQLHGEPLAQACHILNLLDPRNKSFQRAVFDWPTDYNLWRRVSPRQALVLAEGQTRNPEQLSKALVESGGVEDMGSSDEKIRNFQRAVFYEPLYEPAWQALASSYSN